MFDFDSQTYWPQLNKAHLTIDDILPVIALLTENEKIEKHLLGHSFLGKPIHSMTLGYGNIRVLAWTQMHGDEATATASVMDVLSYLISNPEDLPLDQFCATFTLKIIPMLNPDGAQAKTRINAQGIDINRDAVVLQSPEGKILRHAVDTFKPDIALNLHDQSPYYTVGKTAKPATIAFLAPAYDVQKSINAERKRAMQLIAGMNKKLAPYIDGCIARYNDDYSFRSFGDTIAGLGASTILIESGAHPNDPNRQIARKMNVMGILQCFELLRNETYDAFPEAAYFAIPENTENGLGDILIRGASLPSPNIAQHFLADVMLKRRKSPDFQSYIDAIGDLSHLHGFTELDAKNKKLSAGKPYRLTQNLMLDRDNYIAILKQGFSHFVGEAELIENQSSMPILIITSDKPHSLMPNSDGFMLVCEEQTPSLAILDNKVFELEQ